MKPIEDPENYAELQQVLTLSQAAREYSVYRQQLSFAIDLGKIAAVRQGGSVLISRRSLEKYLFPKMQ